MAYDSEQDTRDHIQKVKTNILDIELDLRLRMRMHDRSKLEEPEKSTFDEWTPKLKELTYGSDEYKAALAAMGPALQHHYEHNRHHPEHFPGGINDMSLLDLIEMLCDWQAATQRHANGNLAESIKINCKRFGISDQLAAILTTTAREQDWIK